MKGMGDGGCWMARWRGVLASLLVRREKNLRPAGHVTRSTRPSFAKQALVSPSWRTMTTTPTARHVCIKVPGPKDATRAAYLRINDREGWVKHQLGDDRLYVGRPKNDGGWYLSPTVKAGSIFANPYPLKEFSLNESLIRFRALIRTRAAPKATTAEVIALLPESHSSVWQRAAMRVVLSAKRSEGRCRICD